MKPLVTIAGLAALGILALQTPSATPGESGHKNNYLVVYKPGPGWIAGKPLAEQPLKEHFQYMLGLYKNRSLKFAGPFLDGSGGAVAFEAENEDDAKAVIAADPAVKSQVFIPELHPWRWVNWEQYIKK